MKKFVAFLMITAVFALMLGGCKSSSDQQNKTAESAGTAAAVTEAPTEAATEAPTEAPTVAPKAVDASWFDDAVFIGDSITLALDYYCASDPDALGNAQFVCGTSLGYHNALLDLDDGNAVHPVFQGETILAESAAQATGANKVFILLGVNDIGTYGADDTMDTAKTFAEHLLALSPDVEIYFQSTTPMVAEEESGWLNNDKISDFNTQLQAYCEESGYHFIDVYHQVCDENGALREDYCSDPDEQGIHFNNDGCAVWVNCLKTSVAE